MSWSPSQQGAPRGQSPTPSPFMSSSTTSRNTAAHLFSSESTAGTSNAATVFSATPNFQTGDGYTSIAQSYSTGQNMAQHATGYGQMPYAPSPLPQQHYWSYQTPSEAAPWPAQVSTYAPNMQSSAYSATRQNVYSPGNGFMDANSGAGTWHGQQPQFTTTSREVFTPSNQAVGQVEQARQMPFSPSSGVRVSGNQFYSTPGTSEQMAANRPSQPWTTSPAMQPTGWNAQEKHFTQSSQAVLDPHDVAMGNVHVVEQNVQDWSATTGQPTVNPDHDTQKGAIDKEHADIIGSGYVSESREVLFENDAPVALSESVGKDVATNAHTAADFDGNERKEESAAKTMAVSSDDFADIDLLAQEGQQRPAPPSAQPHSKPTATLSDDDEMLTMPVSSFPSNPPHAIDHPPASGMQASASVLAPAELQSHMPFLPVSDPISTQGPSLEASLIALDLNNDPTNPAQISQSSDFPFNQSSPSKVAGQVPLATSNDKGPNNHPGSERLEDRPLGSDSVPLFTANENVQQVANNNPIDVFNSVHPIISPAVSVSASNQKAEFTQAGAGQGVGQWLSGSIYGNFYPDIKQESIPGQGAANEKPLLNVVNGNEALGGEKTAQTESDQVEGHWFRFVRAANRWQPYSMCDCAALESALNDPSSTGTVMVDCGRYDVNVHRRTQTAVYWSEPETEVVRATWYVVTANEMRPYAESVATALELEYKMAVMSGSWGRRVEIDSGACVVLHSHTVMVHYARGAAANDTLGSAGMAVRGWDRRNAEQGTKDPPSQLFLVLDLLSNEKSTQTNAVDMANSMQAQVELVAKVRASASNAGYIQFLPVLWTNHVAHSSALAEKLPEVTLKNVAHLRRVVNDTALNIACLWTQSIWQELTQAMAQETNKVVNAFRTRHPSFSGKIMLVGHSLASVVAYDLLTCEDHEHPGSAGLSSPPQPMRGIGENDARPFPGGSVAESDAHRDIQLAAARRRFLKKKGLAGSGPGNTQANQMSPPAQSEDGSMWHSQTRPTAHVPSQSGKSFNSRAITASLGFQCQALFALGSPLGLVLSLRKAMGAWSDFKDQPRPIIYNIFHPYDPLANRIEPFFDPAMAACEPVLLLHPKGRRGLHHALWEQGRNLIGSIRSQLLGDGDSHEMSPRKAGAAPEAEQDTTQPPIADAPAPSRPRMDYVLQEAPLESVSEYFFSVGSRHCYWDNDTIGQFMFECAAALQPSGP